MTVQSFSFSGSSKINSENIRTFEELLSKIETLGLEKNIKDLLIKKANRLSPGSYPHFIKNIDHHIESVRK